MEENKDAKTQDPNAASSTTGAQNTSTASSAADVKTEKAVDTGNQAGQGDKGKTEEPWHKDPRFKEFLDNKKALEERAKAFEGIENDPDFAAFLAMKRQKEAMAAKEKEVDFTKMTAEEYANYCREQSREAARAEFEAQKQADAIGDQLTKDVIQFAEDNKIDKATFNKDYAPKIQEYYQSVAKKIGSEKMDDFVVAYPPKEVLKSLLFDKSGELAVSKYKEDVEKAKRSSFEEEGKPPGEKPKDFKSSFDENWAKAFGSEKELPMSAIGRQR